MKEQKYSRRKFISKYIHIGSAFLGGTFLLGYNPLKSEAKNSNKPPQDNKKAAKNPCDDMTGVTPAELAKRKKLAYVTKSPIEDSHCSNCTLYLPPAKGKSCGGCVLFKGPVRAEGYCAYWAPISN